MRLTDVIAIPILLLASCTGTTPAGQFDESSHRRAQEISNQFVYDIAEDSTGQIWIGTFRGLNRFNSRDYFQYFNSSDSTSLPHNQIRSLLMTSGGDLYVGTVSGLCHRNRGDSFTPVDLGDYYLVDDMVQAADSTIFINGSGTSLLSYRPGDSKAVRVLDRLCPGATYKVRLHLNRDNELWIAGDNALRLYDYDNHTLADSIPLETFATNSYLIDGHELWFVGDRLRCFDTACRRFVPLPETLREHPVLSDARIELVHPYGEHGLFLLTSADGMFYLDRESGVVVSQNETGFPINVPDFKIKLMFTDSRGNIWFGSYDRGVAAHYHYTERFNNNKFVSNALENKSVVSTTTDSDNNLWIATRNDGLFVLDGKDKSLNQIPLSELSSRRYSYDESIKNVFADSHGNIWLTLTNAETLRCHYAGNRLVVDKRYQIWGAMSITEDRKGKIWIGTGSAYVAHLDSVRDEFEFLQVFTPGFVFIPGLVAYDDDHIIVAAFNRPIKKVNVNSLEVSPLPVAGESFSEAMDYSTFIPTDLRMDNSGTLWIGTVSHGLVKYTPSDSTFTAVEGVASSDISAIMPGLDSCLWISTLDGLSRYDPASGSFEHFFARDGIGGNQFYDRAAAVDSAGNIYFGGTHGITSFNPREVCAKVPAPLVFQSLMVHNRPVIPGTGIIDRALENAPDIHLDHDHNSFGISYVAVDYCENPRVAYRYKMDGIDKDWVEAGGSTEAYYANVPSGTYIFHVGISGDENSHISLRVIVEGPWWTSWWAILAYMLVFSAIAGILVMSAMKIRAERLAVRKARREKERERHINDMNMRFFANISHEFRTPLTMISGPIKQLVGSSSLSSADKHLLAIADTNVNRMLSLVNQLLDFNRLENDTLPLEVERIDMAALLRQISDTFANHAAGKEISFVINGMEENCFTTADADKIMKIYYNLLSNALKFTPRGGSITVGLDTHDDPSAGSSLKIYVRNTGARIPSDKLEKIFERYYQLDSRISEGCYNCGTGIGLYYARALAKLHHGNLYAVDNEAFDGAEFVLEIPSDPAAYDGDQHKSTPSQPVAYPLSGRSPGKDGDDSDTRPMVLVVDDDIQVAEYMRSLLSATYKVMTCFDADSALEWLNENIPAMIISDVVMPGTDGYRFCRTVKQDLRFSHIPVILLTAKATPEDQVEGLESEADAYVTKPFDPTVLLSQIGSLLRNRERARRMITAGTTVDDMDKDVLSPQDSVFLNDLYGLMEKELTNSELDVNEIARLMNMSRTKFYYKVKGLTGEPPSVFFKTYKLNRAAELIKEHRYTLSEISDMTGFSSLSHFSRSFKKQFGTSPSSFEA